MNNSSTLLFVAKTSNNPIPIEFIILTSAVIIGLIIFTGIQLIQIQRAENSYLQQIREVEEMIANQKKS